MAAQTVSITIPSDQANRVIDAICCTQGYVSGSKVDFCKNWLKRMILDAVKMYECDIASKAAIADTVAEIDEDIVLE